jgi:hypothetical protein
VGHTHLSSWNLSSHVTGIASHVLVSKMRMDRSYPLKHTCLTVLTVCWGWSHSMTICIELVLCVGRPNFNAGKSH